MSRIKILTPAEKKAFDTPPIFSTNERDEFFKLDETLSSMIAQLGSPINQAGFLLQFGYFKATGRFFSPECFSQDDVAYIMQKLKLSHHPIHFDRYKGRTLRRHQKRISQYFHYTILDNLQTVKLKEKINDYVIKCVQPKKIIFSIVQQYRYEKTVLPSFNTLCHLITEAYNQYEFSLLSIVTDNISEVQKVGLNELMPLDKYNKVQPYKRAKLVGIKYLNQSTRPAKIKESVNDFLVIKKLYQQLSPLINILPLTPQATQYYAVWVYKARTAQVKQFPKPMKRYLHLIAFIMHQCCQYQDTHTDVYLKSTQAMLSRIEQKKTQAYYLSRTERNESAQVLVKDRSIARITLKKIKVIGLSTKLNSANKVKNILQLVDESETTTKDNDYIERFEAQLTHAQNDGEHFDQLEASAIGLQRKVSPIVLHVDFDMSKISESLAQAIMYFKNKRGDITDKSPADFLTDKQKKHLYTSEGKWRISLYKTLLFIAMADAIKAGDLTITPSYRYRDLDDYLLNQCYWEKNLSELLKQYELEKFSDITNVCRQIKERLNHGYDTVNTNIQSGKNRYVRFNKEEEIILTTPKVEKPDPARVSDLLKPWRYTSILQVLYDINLATKFTDCFSHYSVKHAKSNPTIQTLFAGIIALGCNIGASKVANTSKGINLNNLNHTLTWYFTLENTNAANDCIVNLIHHLPLPNLFKKEKNLLHTSSDGQKKSVSADSLNANYSFKYYGHGQGVSIYTFIDERCALLYSTVISSAEREAAYVIDGLLHNEVIKSDIHSTDTHGFSEIVFALCYLFGVSFAPRIARLKKQVLYTLTPKCYFKDKNYRITPGKQINTTLIKKYWPTILRLVGSIKAKKTTASQVLKRLSSYAIENPIYKALREFGRMIKTLFILTYINDLELRQKIQKQLNKVELSNRFSNAIFFANNQEFTQPIKSDQEVAVACKRLMQNAIVLWNYLTLSEKIAGCKTEAEKSTLLSIIENGSILTWEHINMHGEYDFLLHAVTNDHQFDMEIIRQLDIS